MDQWYAVHTQAKGEGKAASHLQQQGYRVYLPRWRRRRSHARRVEWVSAPLFPRYLFVRFDVDVTSWRAIRSTIGVRQIVSFGKDLPAPVPKGIVEAIHAREGEDGLVEIVPPFHNGEQVVVHEGPFSGQVGIFNCMDDAQRVTILLDLLGREVRLKVPAYAIEAAA